MDDYVVNQVIILSLSYEYFGSHVNVTEAKIVKVNE